MQPLLIYQETYFAPYPTPLMSPDWGTLSTILALFTWNIKTCSNKRALKAKLYYNSSYLGFSRHTSNGICMLEGGTSLTLSNKMNFRVHSRAAFLDNWDATFYLLNPKHGGAGAALIHSCFLYSGAQGV